MEIYNKLKEVPQKYLKTIQAGRLKGMSDIKPQWRILRLTEAFGECGFGWKISNLKFTYEKANESEIICNCYLEFAFKKGEIWSEPIPGVGGSRFSTMEKNGIYVSDEAEKMAYTDAISVATKMIGLASDVYMGLGGKYDSIEPSKLDDVNSKIIEAKSLEDLRVKFEALSPEEKIIATPLKDKLKAVLK